MTPRHLFLLLALLLPALLLPACRRAAVEKAPEWFADVTAQSGLDFVHDAGVRGGYFMPEHLGSGLAVFDADGDGRLDCYFVQNSGAPGVGNQLWLQKTPGQFTNASAGSGLDVVARGMGAYAGDVNNDGRPDVLLTEYGAVRLFVNLGDGKFREVSGESGLDMPRWATAASFVDYDRDGWLDVVVGGYVDLPPSEECVDERDAREYCGPLDFAPTVARLFRNLARSDTPAFEDVTVRSGFVRAPGKALGILCADFDGDRWPDIFLADDGAPNRLMVNQRDGTFRDEAAARGLAYDAFGATAGNMGVASGDVNDDGLFDVCITHLDREQHGLWVQGPRGFFTEQAVTYGLTSASWKGTGFGAVLADFDADGRDDLALVNGAIERQPSPPAAASRIAAFWAPYAQRAQLFAGETGRLRDVSAANLAFCGPGLVGRGLAAVDFDADGALDLIATSTGGPARLLRNVAPHRGHWLSVRAIEPAFGDREAVGAEIVIEAGGRRWHRLAQPSQSYLSTHDPRAHFGLGGAETVTAIRVIWPDGIEEQFDGGPVNRHVVLRKGEGRERSPLASLPPLAALPAPPPPATRKASAHRVAHPERNSRQWLIDVATELLARRQLDEAAGVIERLVREHPSHPKSWLLAGRAQLLSRDAPAAERAFRRHVEIAPGSEQGHFQLGLALLAQERFADAESAFRRAVEIKPDYTGAHFNRAIAALRTSRPRDAVVALRQAIRCSPEQPEAYLRLASLHVDLGEKVPALRLLRDAALLAPDDPRIRELMAHATALP